MLCLFRVLLIESDFGCLFSHVDVLEEGAVSTVFLLLDCGAELHQLFWHGLVGTFEDVDEPVW